MGQAEAAQADPRLDRAGCHRARAGGKAVAGVLEMSHLPARLPAISFPPVGDADGHLVPPAIPRGLRERTEGVGDVRHSSLRVVAFAAVRCASGFAAPVFRAPNNGEVTGTWGIDRRLGTQNRPLHIGAQGLALDASDALDCRAHLSGNTLLPLVHGAACLA
jgi:hypothetical protein